MTITDLSHHDLYMTLALTLTWSESEIFVVLISAKLKMKNNFSFRKIALICGSVVI